MTDNQINRDSWNACRSRIAAKLGPMSIATQTLLREAWKARRAEARARLQS